MQIFKCAFVMVIMASFWVTEVIPLAITSLFPVVLLPILGECTYIKIRCTPKVHVL